VPRRLFAAGTAGILHDDGYVAEVRPVSNGGFDTQLRSYAANSEGVEAQVAESHVQKGARKALIAILSETASLGSGSRSGTTWNCGESRGNHGSTSSTRSTRCHAIACLI
jgi:hypothetical protein